jgi:hypothetical protein
MANRRKRTGAVARRRGARRTSTGTPADTKNKAYTITIGYDEAKAKFAYTCADELGNPVKGTTTFEIPAGGGTNTLNFTSAQPWAIHFDQNKTPTKTVKHGGKAHETRGDRLRPHSTRKVYKFSVAVSDSQGRVDMDDPEVDVQP